MYKFFCFLFLWLVWHSPSIKADDERVVSLDIARARRIPTSEWIDRKDEVIPQRTKPFHLRIDLERIFSDKLTNMRLFLENLSQEKDVACGEISVINGTSHKFNVLTPGLKAMFQHVRMRQLIYEQGGVQSPATPSRTLKHWGEQEGKVVLKREGRKLILSKEETFHDDDTASIISSVEDLDSVVSESEIEEEKEKLVTQWREQAFDETFNFPERVKVENVLNIHIDDLPKTRQEKGFNEHPYWFVELSGTSDAEVTDIAQACQGNRHIRYLSMTDSSVSIKELEPFFDVLERGQVRLIDVRTALKYTDVYAFYEKLGKFLTKKNKQHLLPRFIWLPWEKYECVSQRAYVPDDVMKRHREFWLVDRVVDLYRDDS